MAYHWMHKRKQSGRTAGHLDQMEAFGEKAFIKHCALNNAKIRHITLYWSAGEMLHLKKFRAIHRNINKQTNERNKRAHCEAIDEEKWKEEIIVKAFNVSVSQRSSQYRRLVACVGSCHFICAVFVYFASSSPSFAFVCVRIEKWIHNLSSWETK